MCLHNLMKVKSDFTFLVEPLEPLQHSKADLKSTKVTFSRIHNTVVAAYFSTSSQQQVPQAYDGTEHQWCECGLLCFEQSTGILAPLLCLYRSHGWQTIIKSNKADLCLSQNPLAIISQIKVHIFNRQCNKATRCTFLSGNVRSSQCFFPEIQQFTSSKLSFRYSSLGASPTAQCQLHCHLAAYVSVILFVELMVPSP